MSVNFLISQAKNIRIVIDENAAEIEALDQNIGDGDHIFNVQRGLKLVVELENDIKNLPLQKGLNMIAMKVLSGIGGSSGALFGTFFMSINIVWFVFSIFNWDNPSHQWSQSYHSLQRSKKTIIPNPCGQLLLSLVYI